MTERSLPMPTPEDLNAYLDGELDGAGRRALERALAENPEAATRLAAYRRQDELLRAGLADLAVAPADRAVATVSAAGRGRRRRRAVVAAAAVTVLALGGFVGGWWLQRGGERTQLLGTLGEQAMLAHFAYASAATPAAPAPPRAEVESRLEAALGAAVAMPELSQFGLHLAAVRAPETGAGGALLLVYRGPEKISVSCYFAPVADVGETAFERRRVGDVGAVYRLDEGIAYAVVGAEPFARLQAIAEAGLRYSDGSP